MTRRVRAQVAVIGLVFAAVGSLSACNEAAAVRTGGQVVDQVVREGSNTGKVVGGVGGAGATGVGGGCAATGCLND